MNYIWYPLIKAIELGYDTRKIRYRVKDRKYYYQIEGEQFPYNAGAYHVSPYLEYLPLVQYDPDNLVSWEEKLSRLDVNPYRRFNSIFRHILTPDRNDPNDLIVCDVIVHILAHIDRICGMSKKGFKTALVINEIESGCYGGNREFDLFSVAEKSIIAEMLIMLYETSNCFRCLDILFSAIMTDFKVIIRDNKEIVFYTPCQYNQQDDKKISFIIKLFVPIDYPYVVHWYHSYGIIGHDESMAIEEFVL